MPGALSCPASPPPTVIRLPQPCELEVTVPDDTSCAAAVGATPAGPAATDSNRDKRDQGAPKDTPRKLVPDFILAMWQHLSPRKTPVRTAALATATAGKPSKLGGGTCTDAFQPVPLSGVQAAVAASAAAVGAAPSQEVLGVKRAEAEAPAAATEGQGHGEAHVGSNSLAEAQLLRFNGTGATAAAVHGVPASAGLAGTTVTAKPPAVTPAAAAAGTEQRRGGCGGKQAQVQLPVQAAGSDVEEGELPVSGLAAKLNNSSDRGALGASAVQPKGHASLAAPLAAAPVPAAAAAPTQSAIVGLQLPLATPPAGTGSSITLASKSGDSGSSVQPAATPTAAPQSAPSRQVNAPAQGGKSPSKATPSSKGQRAQQGPSQPAATAGKRDASKGKGKGSKMLAALRRTLQPGKGSKETSRRPSRQRSPSPAAVSTLVESMAQQAEQLQQQLEALTLAASGRSGGSDADSGTDSDGEGEGARAQAPGQDSGGSGGADVAQQLATLSSQLSQLTLCLHSMQGMRSAGANPFTAALSVQQPPAAPGSDIAGRLFVVFDTNMLIHYLDVVRDWWRALLAQDSANIALLMPLAVIWELDGLKNSIRNYFTARRATHFLHEEVLGKWQYRGQREDELYHGYSPRGDDGIVHCMLYMRARGAQVELCTEDLNLQLRAATEGMAYYPHRAALPTLRWHLAQQQYHAQYRRQQQQQQLPAGQPQRQAAGPALQQPGPLLAPQPQQATQVQAVQAGVSSRPVLSRWDIPPSGKENDGGGMALATCSVGQSKAAPTTAGRHEAPVGKPAVLDRAPAPTAAAARAPLPSLHPAYLQGKR
ncbi:hypothetical protein N2152v2_002598 [Parachlorella kessleri]